MMQTGPLLITSFRPWHARQHGNSSDDLVAMALDQLPADTIWLRQLPVSFQLAPMQVISEIYRRRPRVVICCGMAEKRWTLSLERWAQGKSNRLKSPLSLTSLMENTALSEISNDAGNYVCNHLYYESLSFIERYKLETKGLFLHVPMLLQSTEKIVLRDFIQIVSSLSV